MSREQVPTAKQVRFIAEYLVDLNASEAAVRAGYGRASARYTGSRLLQQPHIKAEVQRLQAAQLEKAGITAERVLEQLRRVAFFDIADCYITESGERRMLHPADWPVEARAALANYDTVVRSVTSGDGMVDNVVKVRLESKLAALELLAKHLGLLTEQTQVDQTMRITWLPPEPPPALPTVETIDVLGPHTLRSPIRYSRQAARKKWDRARRPGPPAIGGSHTFFLTARAYKLIHRPIGAVGSREWTE